MFWQRWYARNREIEAEAEDWIARHGEHAYGLARQRIHEAWRLGDYAERDRWMDIRAAIRRRQERSPSHDDPAPHDLPDQR